jgi:hypothetical protein
LLTNDVEFYWDNECHHAFDIHKEKISSGPNWSLPFHISIDASDSSIGVVLGQKENLLTYVIYFISKNLGSS